MVQIVGAQIMLVGIAYVKYAPVRREGNAVRAALRLSDHLKFASRRDMEHAVEIQFAGVLLVPEGWIGEVHLAILADDYVVGRVQAFTLPAVGEDFDGALLVGSSNPAGVSFAAIKAALRVEGVAT